MRYYLDDSTYLVTLLYFYFFAFCWYKLYIKCD